MKLRILLALVSALLLGLLWGENEAPAAQPEFTTSEVPREAKLDEMLVAGFQVMNTMEQEAMMKVWGEFMAVVEKLPCDPASPYYGINFFTEDYDPQEHTGFGYMAAVPVTGEEGVPEGVVLRKIPARNYIVFEHKGPLKYLEESFNYIFYKYLPQGKYKALYADVLELYDCRFQEDSPDSVIEIWMPVEPQE